MSLILSTTIFLTGLVILILGANWLISGTTAMALRFGISRMIIGITIVALGTSLPELGINLTASLEGAPGITMGNIAGSNLFNTTLVLGASALISPINVHPLIYRDLLFLLLSSVLFVVFYFTGRGYAISRMEGVIFLVLYALYFAYSLQMEILR